MARIKMERINDTISKVADKQHLTLADFGTRPFRSFSTTVAVSLVSLAVPTTMSFTVSIAMSVSMSVSMMLVTVTVSITVSVVSIVTVVRAVATVVTIVTTISKTNQVSTVKVGLTNAHHTPWSIELPTIRKASKESARQVKHVNETVACALDDFATCTVLQGKRHKEHAMAYGHHVERRVHACLQRIVGELSDQSETAVVLFNESAVKVGNVQEALRVATSLFGTFFGTGR